MTDPRPHRAALAAAALATLVAPAAWAREYEPQNNEVAVDIDVSFAKHSQNQADVVLAYTWIPGALNRNDVLLPLPNADTANNKEERSGATQEAGMSLAFSTPEDRLLLTAAAGFRHVGYSIKAPPDIGAAPGDVSGDGVFGELQVSLQLSADK